MELVPIADVEIYYRSAFSRASINASSSMIRNAAESTEGFPYLIQLIGYYLTKLTENDVPVNEELLYRAKEAAFAEVDQKVFQAMLNPLSDLDLAVLHAMAQDDSITKVADLENRLNLSHGTIQTYRRRLLDAGIISSPRRGELSFTIPGLSDYLRRQNVV